MEIMEKTKSKQRKPNSTITSDNRIWRIENAWSAFRRFIGEKIGSKKETTGKRLLQHGMKARGTN